MLAGKDKKIIHDSASSEKGIISQSCSGRAMRTTTSPAMRRLMTLPPPSARGAAKHLSGKGAGCAKDQRRHLWFGPISGKLSEVDDEVLVYELFLSRAHPGPDAGPGSRLGYDGIEPRIAAGHRHGIELARHAKASCEFRQRAAERHRSPLLHGHVVPVRQPAEVAENVEETRRAIDLAADVGAPRIRVFGGVLREGVGRGLAIDLLTDAARGGSAGQASGVTVCMETHDDWSHPDHVAEVMSRVNHPAIRVNWDIMHRIRARRITMDYAYAIVRPWIGHVHFHDGKLDGQARAAADRPGRHRPPPRRAIARGDALHGYLSGEWISWEPYETHLPRELATMKAFEQRH